LTAFSLAVRHAKKAGVLFFACAKVSWSSESVNGKLYG